MKTGNRSSITKVEDLGQKKGKIYYIETIMVILKKVYKGLERL